MTRTGILLVEDNVDDALLAARALQAVGITSHVTILAEGNEAVAYLSGSGKYSDRLKFPLPQLVLLDLQLPGKSGFEVLSWARKQQELRDLPIVIITASPYASSLRTAYLLGSSSFVVKETNFSQYTANLKQACESWLKPPQTAGASPGIVPPPAA